MTISDIENIRKQKFALFCIACAFPVSIGFLIADLLEGNMLEAGLNIMLFFVLAAGFIIFKKMVVDLLMYRVIIALLSAIFLYNTVIGSGNGTTIYWLFMLPILFVFFLGKKEGGGTAVAFFILLSILLINPFSLDIYTYPIGVTFRFLTSMLFVSLMAYSMEASREKYGAWLVEKHATLLEEKKSLERALGEIKTLSGLIPICSNCKKVRDDRGYWQLVETYVSDHSEALFSHSICPDCMQNFYPRLKKEGKE